MINSLDEAIKRYEKEAEVLERLYRLCPSSKSKLFYCDGTKDCKAMKKGKNKGCLKCANEHRQLAKWLKELKDYKDARVGCEYCKHNYREQHERPCSLCRRNFMDMFEMEVNADDD